MKPNKSHCRSHSSPGLLPLLTGALVAAGLLTSAEGQIQTAGELFVDVDATALSPGLLNAIPNHGTLGGFFEARGGGTTVPEVTQIGVAKGITFDGNDYMQLVENVGANLIMAPAGLVGSDPTRTIEVWAFNPGISSEETLVSWGRRGGPGGSNMSFNYGTHGAFGAVGHWGGADIGWVNAGGAPTAGEWHHLVYTYDGTTTRVYSDGVLWNSEVLGAGAINTHANTPINLATQLEGDGVTPTAALRGTLTLAKVRIHDGVLTGSQVADNYNFELPEFMPGGPVEIIRPPQDMVIYETYARNFTAEVVGTPPIYLQWLRNGEPIEGATNLTLRVTPSLADDGTQFSLVASNLVDETVHVATSDPATLTVLMAEEVILKHRYSFNEAPGSLVLEDLVGDADGEIRGGATFSGDGRLALNGVDGYVNLPNDLVMGFTNITIEAWVIDQGSGNWARIYDFGNSTSGEDFPVGAGGAGTQYMFLTSRSSLGTLRGAYTVTGGGAGEQIIEWPGQPLPPNELKHVVWTSHGPMETGRLYVDGELVGSNTAVTLTPADLGPTHNNWLGRAQFNDPRFFGQFEEFRIWDGAMTPAAVQASFAAGPGAGVSGVRLEFTTDPSGVITITWPASAADMFLESTTTLGPGAVWLSAGEIPELVGDSIRVTVFPDGEAKFYRLSR